MFLLIKGLLVLLRQLFFRWAFSDMEIEPDEQGHRYWLIKDLDGALWGAALCKEEDVRELWKQTGISSERLRKYRMSAKELQAFSVIEPKPYHLRNPDGQVWWLDHLGAGGHRHRGRETAPPSTQDREAGARRRE